ncbi:hypothetical protein PENTCL1PPCAC_12999, partial [Pristionchus entomophagus]
KRIFKMFEKYDVGHLTLIMNNNTTSDHVGVLLDLSLRLHSMYIRQFNVFGSNYVEGATNYFFGVQSDQWATIILQMFSGKLDKLIIDNGYAFLSSTGCEQLRQCLPTLGKKVYFHVNTQLNGLDYTENNHKISVSNTSMSIKHISRVDELIL